MAFPNLRVLSLGFMLIVLCMHHCSARKVLLEDTNKQEKAQPKYDINPTPNAHEDMNKKKKAQPKDDIKPVPMAHEDINKLEKAQPKDDIKPAPMAHEDINKLEKAQPKDDIKPSPIAHEDMKNQEKGQPKDDIKATPIAHGDMNKQEKGQPNDDIKVKPAPMAHETDHGLAQKNNKTSSKEGEIGLECGGGGCESPCYELPCNGGGEVIIQPPGIYVPTPPIVVRQPPHIEYPPPVVVPYTPIVEPTPCTPCEPWYGPGPCPCPCEEGYNAETEVIKTDGGANEDESDNKVKEGEMQGRPIIDIPAPSLVDDAPVPAISHGSNVHA